MKEIESEDQPAFIAVDFEELSSGPEQYIQNLITSLGSPDERVRKYAFEVMCELVDERAVKILTGYLDHKDNLVRYSARKALEAIRGKCPGRFDPIIDQAPAGAVYKNYTFAVVLFAVVFALTLLLLILFNKPRGDNYLQAVAERSGAGAAKRSSAEAPAGANVIKFDEKGAPSIKINGSVSSYNSIKREALVDLNSYGDRCRVKFAEDMKVDFLKGSMVEIDAEILHNDNINPVLLKAKSIKPAGIKR
jgi:HEAT repeat protein